MSNEKRKYVGARYVPLFSDPLEWSNTRTYEPLTIVLNEGNSYTSRQFVPTGIDISNESYWALTGNYNAQVEQYRQDIAAIDAKYDKRKTVMLAFGDSFGTVSATAWPQLVAKALGKTLDNFCIGGATWPLTQNLANAVAAYNTQEKKDTIAFAVAYAGINSTVANTIDSTNIVSFITAFNAAFPGVPLFIAPLNNCNPYNTNFPEAYKNTMKSVPGVYMELKTATGNFILLENSHLYNTGKPGLWNADKLHPTQAGSQTIANNMVSSMAGNNTMYTGLKTVGDFPETSIVKTQGFIDSNGITIPEIKATVTTGSANLYYHSAGYYFYKRILRYCLYNTNGTVNDYFDGRVYIMSDPTHEQFFINIANVAMTEGQFLFIPSQTIPFTVETI